MNPRRSRIPELNPPNRPQPLSPALPAAHGMTRANLTPLALQKAALTVSGQAAHHLGGNRDPEQAIHPHRLVRGLAYAGGRMTSPEVSGGHPSVSGSFGSPGRVTTRRAEEPVKGDGIGAGLPPHSFTTLEVELA
jgi:hypothetical protein